jgi:hypothetical protein
MKDLNTNLHQVKVIVTKALKRILPLLIIFSLIILPTVPAQASELTALKPQIHATERYSAIQTPEQAILYLNAQNLVDTWNNIIIQAKTGDEQLKIMRESGVFADDVKLTFEFANQKLDLNGLSSKETRDFYNGFVNSLKKNRYNIASNVEAVEFGKDSLRFNFKHWIFFDDRLSLVGENQAVMKRENGKYSITSADIRVIYLDVDHAY